MAMKASCSDSLIRHIVFVTKSGKQRCKFKGNVSELHDFVKFVLKINGSWSHARDLNHCIFKSNCKQITINFWQSTQSFTVCGKKEKEIKKKLKTLASSFEKSLMRNDTTSKERYSTVTSPLLNRTLQGSNNKPEGSVNTRETPSFQSDIESPTRQMNYADADADAFDYSFDSRLRPIRTELDRIWSLIQSLSTRFEENHKLFDELLQTKKLSVQNN